MSSQPDVIEASPAVVNTTPVSKEARSTFMFPRSAKAMSLFDHTGLHRTHAPQRETPSCFQCSITAQP
jgi:hypothetical protein